MMNRSTIMLLKLYKKLVDESRRFIEVMNNGGSSKELTAIKLERESLDKQFERLNHHNPGKK